MNRIYRVLWNRNVQQWIAVSEASKGQTKATSVVAVGALTALLFSSPSLAGVCPGDERGQRLNVSGQVQCDAMQSTYRASVGSDNALIDIKNNAVINFKNANVTITNTNAGNGAYGVRINHQSTINADGNITINVNARNSRGILLTSGNVNVAGDLVINKKGLTGAIIEQEDSASSNLVVGGNAVLKSERADGFRARSHSHFKKDLTIEAANHLNGFGTYGQRDAKSTIDGNLNISTKNMATSSLNFSNAAELTVGGQANISADKADAVVLAGSNAKISIQDDVNVIGKNLRLGAVVINSGASVHAGKNFSITTSDTKEASLVIGKSGAEKGILHVGSNLVIDDASSGAGVSARKGDVRVQGSAKITMLQAQGSAIQMLDDAAIIEVQGSDSKLMTKGAGNASGLAAYGIYATGGSATFGASAPTHVNAGDTLINFAAGEITTAGEQSHGIYAAATTTGKVEVRNGGTISTEGVNSAGIYIDSSEVGAATINNNGTIISAQGNAIDASAALSGASISSTGMLSGANYAILGSSSADSVTLFSGTVVGDIQLSQGDNKLTIIDSVDLTASNNIDGGSGANNVLAFEQTIQNFKGSQFANWQTATLDATTVTLTDDSAFITGAGLNTDGSARGISLTNGSTLTGSKVLNLTGDMTIDGSSSLVNNVGGTVNGNVANSGAIVWANPNSTNALSIHGHYVGEAGSSLSMNTYLAGDDSATDKLVVSGDTSGITTIAIKPMAGSPGAQTQNGIEIVSVGGTSAANSFSLAAPVQAGAYEYILQQGGAQTAGQNWYLTSSLMHTPEPAPETIETPIYRPGVANYVATQAINNENAVLQLSTYHQRIGGQFDLNEQGLRTWLRAYYQHNKADGKERFDYKANFTGFQAGKEVALKRNDNGSTDRYALTLDYGHTSADIYDAMRPVADLNRDAGDLTSHSLAVGGTWTRNWAETSYVDVVAQLAYLRNRFTDSYSDKATQKGWRIGFSAEAGTLLANWGAVKLEGQAQLLYTHTRYKSFDDVVSHVDGYNLNFVRGRAGLRLYAADANRLEYYGIANIIHDFTNGKAVEVGGSSVKEKFNRSRAEIGVGIQPKLQKDTYAYADLRYQHGLGSGKAKATQINVGFKKAF